MIRTIYIQTLNILKKIPIKLWGLTLLSELLTIIAVVLGMLPVITIPLCAALSAGMNAVFYKAYTNGGNADSSDLFKPFRSLQTFKRTAGGICWMYLWLFLWFIIPVAGPFIVIYKSLQYGFTPYILNEEPEVSGLQALKKSKEDTKGYKGYMFLAIVLPYIAYAVVLAILGGLSLIPYVGIVFTILGGIFSIIWSLVSPLFFGLVEAGFYNYKRSGLSEAAPVYTQPAYTHPVYTQPVYTPPAPQPQQPAPDAEAGQSCPVCGAENGADKKFCTKCGAKL